MLRSLLRSHAQLSNPGRHDPELDTLGCVDEVGIVGDPVTAHYCTLRGFLVLHGVSVLDTLFDHQLRVRPRVRSLSNLI